MGCLGRDLEAGRNRTGQLRGELRNETNSSSGVVVNFLKKIRRFGWRFKILIIMNVIGLLVDPLLLYMFGINGSEVCIRYNKTLGIAAFPLLTVFDIFYFIFELDCKLRRDAKGRFLFFFQVVNILPISQMMMIIFVRRDFRSFIEFAPLYVSLALQHLRRLIPVLQLSKKVIASRNFAHLCSMFIFYIVYFSHLNGGFWYLLAINKVFGCWKEACRNDVTCISHFDTCDKLDVRGIKEYCKSYDDGIVKEALTHGVLDSNVHLHLKILYCFRQGMQSLSNFGQNLEPGSNALGNIFTILVVVFGIISFPLLLGLIQIYLQFFITRFVAKEKKLQELEHWWPFQNLSEKVQSQIKKYMQEDCQEIEAIDLVNVHKRLPKNLKMELNRELCLERLKNVEVFARWSEAFLLELCDNVKPVFYNENKRIIREASAIDRMILIVRGEVWTYRKAGSSSMVDIRNSRNDHTEDGDFHGKQLISSIQANPYTIDLPISSTTIQAYTEVEAFVLPAATLKLIFVKRREKSSSSIWTLRIIWVLRLRMRDSLPCS